MTAQYRGYLTSCCIGTAVVLVGCLPDPPPYDACAGGESHYYVVAPKGCSGHELVTLYELETEQPMAFQSAGTQWSYFHRTLELDDDSVYWQAPNDVILQTAKRERRHVPLYQSLAAVSGVVGLNRSTKRLYVGEVSSTTIGPAASRNMSRIIGLDLTASDLPTPDASDHFAVSSTPSYAHVLAELADISLSRVAIDGDRFFFTSDYASAIRSGKLDWSSTTRTTDLDVALQDLVTDFALVDSTHLYYISSRGPSLQLLDLGSGTSKQIREFGDSGGANPQLVNANGTLYLYQCDDSQFQCVWSRVEVDGTSRIVAEGLINQGIEGSFTGDATAAYVLGNLGSEQYGISRLLGFTRSSSMPEVLAAPFQIDAPMALDAEFVYVAAHSSTYVDGQLGGGTATLVADRLLRVRR